MKNEIQPRDLTDLQAAFVAAYTSDDGCRGRVKESAIAAGYSPKTAREIGRQVLALPHIQAAIFEANKRQISGPLATKAVHVVYEILHDENAPKKLKLEAAKTVLDRAGFVPPKADEPARSNYIKALTDMSIPELEKFIREGREAQHRADMPMLELRAESTEITCEP
jgi:phage terminase small subunit